jgi:chorismate dehydratase
MADLKLRIGRIPFANLFPIFYTLEKEFDCSSYAFVNGVPSVLNEMLREGSIDLSPSSSVEYLRNPQLYGFVDGVSVSSIGPVGSIFLFSRKPIDRLDGSVVYVTSQSATSVALLDIVLRRFSGIRYTSMVSGEPYAVGAEAFLLIGDEALRFGAMFNRNAPELSGYEHMYDLGEVWHEKTGLPFVFALWIVRNELFNKTDARHRLFAKFTSDLVAAKERSLHNLVEIAGHSPMKSVLSEDDIITYWKMLDYELNDEHKKGLYLFRDYLC